VSISCPAAPTMVAASGPSGRRAGSRHGRRNGVAAGIAEKRTSTLPPFSATVQSTAVTNSSPLRDSTEWSTTSSLRPGRTAVVPLWPVTSTARAWSASRTRFARAAASPFVSTRPGHS
jgi:hypothetical protein